MKHIMFVGVSESPSVDEKHESGAGVFLEECMCVHLSYRLECGVVRGKHLQKNFVYFRHFLEVKMQTRSRDRWT